jgi:predicted component of type VI protein secretion system
MESCVEYWERNSCIMRYVSLGAVLARIYTKAALKEGRLTWSIMLHNPRGMLKLGPGCRKRAMYWLDRCSREAQEADMKPVLGQLRYLQGRLQAAAGRADQAGESFSQALELLLTCGASADVARVRQEMGRLGNVDHA